MHLSHETHFDFALAYQQAVIKTDIFMKPPRVPPDFVIPDLPTPLSCIINVYKPLIAECLVFPFSKIRMYVQD